MKWNKNKKRNSNIPARKKPHGCQFDGSYAITLLTLKQQCIRQTDSREVLFVRV
jgi:hypothetical protein